MPRSRSASNTSVSATDRPASLPWNRTTTPTQRHGATDVQDVAPLRRLGRAVRLHVDADQLGTDHLGPVPATRLSRPEVVPARADPTLAVTDQRAAGEPAVQVVAVGLGQRQRAPTIIESWTTTSKWNKLCCVWGSLPRCRYIAAMNRDQSHLGSPQPDEAHPPVDGIYNTPTIAPGT